MNSVGVCGKHDIGVFDVLCAFWRWWTVDGDWV